MCLERARHDWHALCSKVLDCAQDSRVQRLCLLLYALAAFQVGNPAWSSFLSSSLGYATRDIEILNILGNVASMAAIAIYQVCCESINFKILLVLSILSTGLINLILVLSLENGTTDVIFFQDGIVVSIVTTVSYMGQALQLCILYSSFIDFCAGPGYTGVFYATFTSTLMFGATASKVLGNQLLQLWSVSHVTLGMHDYSGFRYLTLLCSALPALPAVAVLFLLPAPFRVNQCPPRTTASHVGTALVVFYVVALSAAVSSLRLSATDLLADEYP